MKFIYNILSEINSIAILWRFHEVFMIGVDKRLPLLSGELPYT